VTLNDLLRYFAEFVYDVVAKQFTFAISFPDEFPVCIGSYRYCRRC